MLAGGKVLTMRRILAAIWPLSLHCDCNSSSAPPSPPRGIRRVIINCARPLPPETIDPEKFILQSNNLQLDFTHLVPERFLLFQSKHSKQPEKGSDFGRGYCSPHLDNETKHCFTSSTNHAGLDSPGARLIGLGAQSRLESEWRQ